VVSVTLGASPITGTTSICSGTTSSLSNAASGGAWSSSNTTIATVSGGGSLAGVTPGTATISYTLLSGCSSVTTVTINQAPASITGTTSLCAGSSTSLSDAIPGGAWISGNTIVATINPGTGLVNGLVVGTSAITYTLGYALFIL